MLMNTKTKSIAIVILCLSIASFGVEPVSISHSITSCTVDDTTTTLNFALEIVNNSTTVMSGTEIKTAPMGPLRKRLGLIFEPSAILIGDIPAAGLISVDYSIESAYVMLEEAMDHIPIFWEVGYIDGTAQPQIIVVRSEATGGEPELTTETTSVAVASLSDSGVNEEWVARYNGPGNGNDYAEAIAMDASGNVYVTGYSYSIGSYFDCATVKYDSSGNQLWLARYDGQFEYSDDLAYAIAVDASGNVYVAGISGDSWGIGDYDYITIKYDSSGNQLWEARYNGPGNYIDFAEAIDVDVSGNVYVTGVSYSSSLDYATIKYDSSGNEQWVARYNGPGNYGAYAYAVAVDASGNVYVTGQTVGSSTGYDYATVKYDSFGNQLWEAMYNGPGNSSDYACAMALDAQGNVYVTGQSVGNSTGYDYATIKYDSSGSQLWEARYNGPANYYDYAYAIALDAWGNVYVTGRSYGDYATVKYDTSGSELWVKRYNGPVNLNDEAYAIAVDASGNVYVTGQSYDSGSNYDYATVKYDTSGNEIWAARYNAFNYNDSASTIAVDLSGNVYVTGQSYSSGTNYDYATIKYSSLEDPPGAIEALISAVISLNLQQGITNSLDVKLGAALNALDDVNNNNDVAAINTLDAFINAVEAQRGLKICETDADILIRATVNIINMLSSPLK